MDESRRNQGIVFSTLTYIIWGFLPIYWKFLDHVSAGEILGMRILWAFIFMLVVILISRKWHEFIKETKVVLKNRRRLLGITLASIIISLNWLTYIWAVNNGYVLEASLGYYINPLISILLGILILKESVTTLQIISFCLAGLGVLYLTFSYGVFPWISLVLALTFAFYGLLKKTVQISEVFGLTIETMILAPFALLYLSLAPQTDYRGIFSPTTLLFIGAGVVTAVPLLLFAYGARRIPMSMLGFLQYISPTIMLLLGVFLFKETFSKSHLISFVMIWTALLLYMRSTYQEQRYEQAAGD